MKKLLTLILVILIAGCSIKPEESCMAIEFTGAVGQRIDYGSSANVYGLSQKSISFWAYLDSVTKVAPPWFVGGLIDDAPTGDEAWVITIGDSNNGAITFTESFDDTAGVWDTAVDVLSVSTVYHIVITYDNSDVANNPIVYVSKVSKSLTEAVTPVGNAYTGTNGQLRIGANGDSLKPIDGWEQDFRIYDRILTQAEINELHDSRCQRVVTDGLVFWSRLDGAAGLSAFDGVTLAAGNTLLDEISGAVGVPSGSPVGRGNTIQRIY